MMTGVMLLTMLSSCKPPTFKKPVQMFAISLKWNEAGVGYKILDYKQKKTRVGEWVQPTDFVDLEDVPENIICFSMDVWLKKVKPKLKEASDYYNDNH